MNKLKNKNYPLKRINTSKVILPTIIGLGVVIFFMVKEFDPKSFNTVSFTHKTIFWLLIATILMAFRDIGYIWRIMILTDKELTLKQAIRIVFLWEFTSSVTPSAIGGTSVAILYINKEGISIGKSSAVVMATSFLDELYFILMFPLLLIFTNHLQIFGIEGISFKNPFFSAAIIGYSLKFIWVLIVAYGLFINPRGLKWLLIVIFKLPFLRKWRHEVAKAGTDIIKSSKELRKKNFAFWIKSFIATFFSWTSRYWIVNAIFLSFFTFNDHLLLFTRQLVMWIMMIVSPTPGGSGFSEYVFSEYLTDIIPISGIAILLAFIWRLLTYYPYLIIGVFLFPKWIKEKFKRKI